MAVAGTESEWRRFLIFWETHFLTKKLFIITVLVKLVFTMFRISNGDLYPSVSFSWVMPCDWTTTLGKGTGAWLWWFALVNNSFHDGYVTFFASDRPVLHSRTVVGVFFVENSLISMVTPIKRKVLDPEYLAFTPFVSFAWKAIRSTIALVTLDSFLLRKIIVVGEALVERIHALDLINSRTTLFPIPLLPPVTSAQLMFWPLFWQLSSSTLSIQLSLERGTALIFPLFSTRPPSPSHMFHRKPTAELANKLVLNHIRNVKKPKNRMKAFL